MATWKIVLLRSIGFGAGFAVVLCAAVGYWSWHNRRNKQAVKTLNPTPTVLWMDDVAYPRSGEEFESAFALEPSCRGLVFKRWNKGAADIAELDKKPHWEVFYNGSDGTGAGFTPPIYAVRISANNFEGPDVSVQVTDAADAAKKVCFVAYGRGGKSE